MNRDEMKSMLMSDTRAWNEWRKNNGKVKIDLTGVYLYGADIRDANLADTNLSAALMQDAYMEGVDLRRANLSKANMHGVNLCHADLRGGNLRGTNLVEADLRGANMTGTDMCDASLICADLRGTDLTRTKLFGVRLHGGDLCGAVLNYENMLGASWENVPDDLCRDLMRYDCSLLDGGERLFKRWAGYGPCPYDDVDQEPAANFWPVRGLWSPGPAPTALELVERLFDHFGVKR